MRRLLFERFGPPHEVVRVVETDEPPAPGPHQALVELLASPIHPADLMTIAGHYNLGRQTLPRTPGKEGVGKVLAVGATVKHVKPGDLTPILLDDGVWQERHLLDAENLIALPPGGDVRQYSMLAANPATASLLLSSVVPLGLGEWVIQNAANSAVGRYLILLARRAGVRTVNVVRRAEAAGPLHALGADVVLVDAPGLAGRVEGATGGARIRLAVDAVGGGAAARLIECLADGGTLANYGALSGRPVEAAPAHLIFRGIHVRGFWLPTAMRAGGADLRRKLFAELIPLVATGVLKANVEAVYPLERAPEALAHAAREHRDGKVLFARS